MSTRSRQVLTAVGVLCALLAWFFFVRSRKEDQAAVTGAAKTRAPAPQVAELPAPLALVPVATNAPSPLAIRNEEIRTRLRAMNLSPAVRAVVGLDPEKANGRARTAALNTLTPRLSTNDIDGLTLFLHLTNDKATSLPDSTFTSLKSDVLEVLVRQDAVPDGLGGEVVAMFHDRDQGDVWRDYCLQYLSSCYDAQQPVAAAMTNDPARTAMLDAYQSALLEKDKTLAGTAMIGLEYLSRRHSEVSRQALTSNVLALANDEACGEGSRITALRMCAMLGSAGVLPTARVLAQTGQTTTLRMAAIATIGDLGDGQDINLLTSLAGGSEKHISGIASNALTQLKQRLAPPSAAATTAQSPP